MDMIKILTANPILGAAGATTALSMRLKPSLENLASQAFSEIASHLSEKDILSLRATSKDTQGQVRNIAAITEGLVEISRKVRDTENPFSFDALFPELFEHIGQYLSKKDILALRVVSTAMKVRVDGLNSDANNFVQFEIARGHENEARLNALEARALSVLDTAEKAWFFSGLTERQKLDAFVALVKTGNFEGAHKLLRHMNTETLEKLDQNLPKMLTQEGKALLRVHIDNILQYRDLRNTVLLMGVVLVALAGVNLYIVSSLKQAELADQREAVEHMRSFSMQDNIAYWDDMSVVEFNPNMSVRANNIAWDILMDIHELAYQARFLEETNGEIFEVIEDCFATPLWEIAKQIALAKYV